MPPLRSIRIIRKICRNRRLRSAEVAKTFPWEPAASTAMEAINTMMSVGDTRTTHRVSLPWAPKEGISGPIDMPGHVGPWEGRFPVPTPLPTCGTQGRLPTTLSLPTSIALWAPTPSHTWKQFLPQTQLCWLCPPGLTNHTERLPGKLEPSPPASVPAAAACGPDPHKVLNAKHHDGHDFLGGGRDTDEDAARHP